MESINTQVEQPTQNSNSFVIYVLLAVIVILLSYIGYVYSSKEMVNKKEMHEQYIKKADITFDTLPIYIQNKYVLKSLYDYKVKELDTRNLSTVKKLEEVIAKNKEEVVKKIIENKDDIDTKIDTKVTLIPKKQKIQEPTVSNIISKSHTSKTYTCKTLRSSSEYITKRCKNELNRFLDSNKDATRFEVIGLIDNKEFLLIKKLQDVYGKQRVGNLSKYAQRGLSKQRVIEASWAIRQHLGKDIQLNSVNYTITKKNKRGFIVKAYK